MITIPLRISKPVDLTKPLSFYIKNKYKTDVGGSEGEFNLGESLSRIQELRNNAVSVSSAGVASTDALVGYCKQLLLLESRFPIVESNVS